MTILTPQSLREMLPNDSYAGARRRDELVWRACSCDPLNPCGLAGQYGLRGCAEVIRAHLVAVDTSAFCMHRVHDALPFVSSPSSVLLSLVVSTRILCRVAGVRRERSSDAPADGMASLGRPIARQERARRGVRVIDHEKAAFDSLL